jgi:hypothetical protein
VIREDPDLPVPVLPGLAESPGPLGAEIASRAVPSDAADPPLLLAGRRAWALGGVRSGVQELAIPPFLVADGPVLRDATATDAVMSPLGLERRLLVDRVEVVERTVVPRDGAFAVMEWSSTGPVRLDVLWRLRLPAADARFRRVERGLILAGREGTVAVAFSRAADLLEVSHEANGPTVTVRAGLRLLDPGTLRVVVAAGADRDGIERALRAANRTRALVQARRGAAERLRADRIATTTPDPAFDLELEWVKLRLADRVMDMPGIGRVVAEPRRGGDWSVEATAAVRLALDALAVGDPEPARALLAVGMVSAPPYQRGTARPEDDAGLQYLVARFADQTGDPGVGRHRWSGDQGPEDQARQPGVPPAHDPEQVLPRLDHLLGARPDATRDRLALRPRPPLAWDRFRVTGIPVGDASVSLDYRRHGDVHRLAVWPERGATPLQIVLEPELPGDLVAARVDGQTADLLSVPAAGRTRVPVQLALDHERVLELEMKGALEGTGSGE